MMMSFPRQVFLLVLAAWSFSINNVAEGIPLLGGRYETTTDVQTYLNLALDAADMKEAEDLATKQLIYESVSDSKVIFGMSKSVAMNCLPHSHYLIDSLPSSYSPGSGTRW
jgi:hypothetical protein